MGDLNARANGETVVDETTTTSYYVEVCRLNGEWMKVGRRSNTLAEAIRNAPLSTQARILIHTRHIMDVDTWITL